jgi:hypothetical protein
MPLMVSSPARAALLALAVSLTLTTAARAASLPPRAEIGLTSGVDAGAFRRLVLSRYHVEYRVVLAADVDRDGDLDVLATTDRGVTLWVNDGAGHLRAHRLPHRHVLEASGLGHTWRGRDVRIDPTIQDSGPQTPICVVRAHAPPRSDVDASAAVRAASPLACHIHRSSPRAPPA